jgi:multidrug efflux pump subunit AcrB
MTKYDPFSLFFNLFFNLSFKGFVNGLLTGLAICFPIAFVVLWFATGNIILAIYATAAIGSVVCSVLGFCQAIMGWSLGVAESVAGIIVIGFSVDYVVHMAHMYTEAEEKTGATSRIDRFTYAAEKMGLTIIGGAITTAGSGSMMFLCQMVFFFKMGLLVCMTILFSVIYSLGFFMALCVLWGPEHDAGNTRVMLQRWFGNGKITTAVVQDTNAKAKEDVNSTEECKEDPKEVEMALTTNKHFKHEVSEEDIIV